MTSHRRLAWLAIITLGLAAVASGLAVAATLANLPPPEEMFSRRIVQSTKIYDRGGTILLYEIHGEEKRTIIPFDEIPAAVKNATIALEDANFYRHRGVDARGILRALITDIVTGDFRQGGSTITQQLVKNSLLGHERTIRRKIREAVFAMALEARLTKEDILNLYLNQIPYGANAYGIEAAAQTFFGKHARDIGIAEAAFLAALPAAPSYYSPYGQHRDELLARKNRAIERMERLGYLSAPEAERTKAEPIALLPAARNIRAPHFVMFVRDYLIARYGEEEVESGGLMVTTTLDGKLQQAAEEIVRTGAERNEALIRAENMALVAIDPKSGDILAMVGSRDYFDVSRDGNFNVATALRQPGSAFKPFVYATAFKKGLTPETVLFDLPTEFNPLCTPAGQPRPGVNLAPKDCYHPGNYDEMFRGPVTLRQGLAQSLNVPSVKALYLAGIEDSIRTAEDFGIGSLKERERFGLSLVLGGAEVKLLEMTSAYGALANDGLLNAPVSILRVATADGRILEEKRAEPRPVIDPEIARLISDILSDDDARVPVFQRHSSLYFPDRRVAAKTGTTQDFRDAWTIGYAPNLAVGVWAGNNDNSPMRQKGSGVMAAAPSWHQFMAAALAELPEEDFVSSLPRETDKPVLKGLWQGEVVIAIDTISGQRATEYTPPETRRDTAFGRAHDPLHWIDRDDPAGPPPEDPSRDPQYANWEAAFQEWLPASGVQLRSLAAIPQGFDDIHSPEKRPQLTVQKKSAADGSVILQVAVAARYGLREVALLIEDRILATRARPPPLIEFTVPAPETDGQTETVEVRAYDLVGNIGSTLVTLP